ncbi:MAG: hypothetical protein AAF318_10620 [Pseudomonadota bacterium]
MTKFPHWGLATATALSLVMTAGAHAQTRISLNEDKVAGLTGSCATLAERVEAMDGAVDTRDQAERIVSAINDNDLVACDEIVLNMGSAETVSAEASADASVQAMAAADDAETVTVTDEVQIEGEAVVQVPEPDVDVTVAPPQVTVRKTQPEVSITAAPTNIELRQARPTVRVEVPELRVTVEIPAPAIYVLSEAPDVSVTNPDPAIEVSQAEPTVSVRQADPQLALAVDAEDRTDDAATDRTASDRVEAGTMTPANAGSAEPVASDVSTQSAEASVEFMEPEEAQAQISFDAAEPTIEYRDMTPEVTVTFAEEPTVQIVRTGDPQVTFETMEERNARRAEESTEEAASNQTPMPAIADGEMEAADSAEPLADPAMAASNETGQTFRVEELMDMTVIAADGNDVGQPEAFIELAQKQFMIVSEGGFLGFGGTDLAIPVDRLSVAGSQIRLSEMTEAEMEAASDFDYPSDAVLEGERSIAIN